jgi:hypothetical protein
LEDAKKGKLPHEDFEFLASIVKKKSLHGSEGNLVASIVYAITAPEAPTNPDIRSNVDTPNTTSYLSVKTLKHKDGTQGHRLSPGDVVRLGRLSFLVAELRDANTTHSFKNPSCKDLVKKGDNVLMTESRQSGTCRICLSDEVVEKNFLVSACKCSGSCEFVHVDCLKIWIDSKIKKESRGVATVFNFSKFEC